MTDPVLAERSEPAPIDGAPAWRGRLSAALILVAVLLGLLFIWFAASSLLILFAGILFAAFLDACARALKPVLPFSHTARLVVVIALFTVLVVLGAVRGAAQLPEQMRSLVLAINAQLDVLQERLLQYGIDTLGPEGGRNFAGFIPDIGQLFGHATVAVGTATSVVTTTIVIVFVGLSFAFDPAGYRDGFVRLMPKSARPRVRSVLNEMGAAMRYWLIGQAVRMLLLGVATWLALYWLKIPGAFLLGVQAGILNFIPYLGPIVAGIPIALVTMQLGTSTLLWAIGIYTLVQSIEGYIIGPLIQKQAANVSPAWTLVGIVLLGSLFGTLGVALAMPLMAIGRIALLRFYVEDRLGDRA